MAEIEMVSRLDKDVVGVDLAVTYLTLIGIATYPQLNNGPAEWMIAEYLVEHLGENSALMLTEVESATIDPEIAWEFTRNIHKTNGIGTNRPSF